MLDIILFLMYNVNRIWHQFSERGETTVKRNTISDEARLQRGKKETSTSQSKTGTTDSDGRNSQSTAFTFRLPREELIALEQAASQAGLSVSEYLRKAAALRPALSVLARPQFNLSVGTPYSQYGSLVTWNESPTYIAEFKTTSDGVTLRGISL